MRSGGGGGVLSWAAFLFFSAILVFLGVFRKQFLVFVGVFKPIFAVKKRLVALKKGLGCWVLSSLLLLYYNYFVWICVFVSGRISAVW